MTPVVVTDQRGLVTWQRYAEWRWPDVHPWDAFLLLIREAHQTPFCWDEPIEGGHPEFSWACPACGVITVGILGNLPASPWPPHRRWRNTGSYDKPTLEPLLTCALHQSGQCTAEWVLRDGQFLEAGEED